jgi:hypothetical protein
MPAARELDEEKLGSEENLAESQIKQKDDPFLAATGMRHLWWTESADILSDWSKIDALDHYQQDRLMQIVATDIACNAVAICGPNSPWTIAYCGLEAGTICPSGMSFEEVVSLNLSPMELDLRQEILANLSKNGLF